MVVDELLNYQCSQCNKRITYTSVNWSEDESYWSMLKAQPEYIVFNFNPIFIKLLYMILNHIIFVSLCMVMPLAPPSIFNPFLFAQKKHSRCMGKNFQEPISLLILPPWTLVPGHVHAQKPDLSRKAPGKPSDPHWRHDDLYRQPSKEPRKQGCLPQGFGRESMLINLPVC